ncbi:hypothetical protein [Oceanicaulis sp.]|uniref:hypothetical protein n=1 Tax=Oceanicaulis sp. TaxID=1924941 RepID=UPI003D291423
MNRQATKSDPADSYAARLKPVFTPGIPPIEALEPQVYLDAQTESYDAVGAPRLHLGASGTESGNPLVRVMLNGSALTPTLRRVFIPSKSGCTSFLIEWADGEPGLVVLALEALNPNEISAQVSYLPMTDISDISQGDHDGLLQITVPTSCVAQTLISIQKNGAGDLKYRTENTTIAFDELSSDEAANLKRFMDMELAAEVASVCGAFGFELTDMTATSLQAALGVGLSSTTKKVAIGVLQVGGLIATGLSFAFGPIAAGVGGALRGVAGLTGLVTPRDDGLEDVPGRGAPMVVGRRYLAHPDPEDPNTRYFTVR